MQDVLEKSKKTTYFKLTLPNMGKECKVAVWVPGTPEQFLLHVRLAIHVCQQMGLDAEFAEAKKGIETCQLDVEIMKGEYVQACNSE